MIATETAPDTYLVTESDETWRGLLEKCRASGHVILKDSSGLAFELTPMPHPHASRPKVSELPNFAARRAQLGPSRLDDDSEAEFFRSIRGE